MDVKILEEHGYINAIKGFGYSFMDSAENPDEFYTVGKFSRIEKAALAHANSGKGMNKFRRQIMVWLDVRAPRFWFSEFDTYKVGTVAQSTSTMHTLMKRDMTLDDVEESSTSRLEDFIASQIFEFNELRHCVNFKIEELKSLVPEAYLQRRLVTLNYEVLSAIINQRKNHRLPQWRVFIGAVYSQCEHRELLPDYPYEH